LPNVPGAAINSNNYSANDPIPELYNDYVARIDQKFSDKDSVYGRFLAQPDHENTSDVYPTAGTDSYGVLSHNYYYNPSATWNHIFRPTLLNEARATFSFRQALSIGHGVNSAAATQLALPGVNPIFFPGVTVTGLAAIGNTSQQRRLQTPILSNDYADNLSWQRGNHQFKFGGDYRTSADGDLYSPSGGGIFTFTPAGASTNTAAGSLANLLLWRSRRRHAQRDGGALLRRVELGLLRAGRLALEQQAHHQLRLALGCRFAALPHQQQAELIQCDGNQPGLRQRLASSRSQASMAKASMRTILTMHSLGPDWESPTHRAMVMSFISAEACSTQDSMTRQLPSC
jgi:hypothetical protein